MLFVTTARTNDRRILRIKDEVCIPRETCFSLKFVRYGGGPALEAFSHQTISYTAASVKNESSQSVKPTVT